jgi:prevent-host-death family protein
MKEAKISEIKNQLSRYLSLVRNGETVRILDRNRPIAHIVPIGESVASAPVGEEALAEMERKGLIRRGTGRVDVDALGRRDRKEPNAGVLAALLEERDSR